MTLRVGALLLVSLTAYLTACLTASEAEKFSRIESFTVFQSYQMMLISRIQTALVTGLMALVLSACGSDESQPVASNLNSQLTIPIDEFLDPAVVDQIQLDDGAFPVTQGDWPRFTVNTTWNWQLNGELNTSYEADVYVIDMFEQLTENEIEPLKAGGTQVICYFSAGTYEYWRPDVALFDGVEFGNPHIGFQDELWLDINDPKILKIMANRMDIAVMLGCDGVELDNVDGFINDTGHSITQEDALVYSRILANEAHKRGLAVALKNNVELVNDVVDYFDLLINEECFQYNECEGYLPIIEAGKPVFNAEYTEVHVNDPVQRELLCMESRSINFQTLILPLALDGSFRFSCQ